MIVLQEKVGVVMVNEYIVGITLATLQKSFYKGNLQVPIMLFIRPIEEVSGPSFLLYLLNFMYCMMYNM